MPRYFFDIIDGERLHDEAGIELANLAEARGQAMIALAGALMPDVAPRLRRSDRWRIEARDEAGVALFSLEYLARPTTG